MIPRDVAVHLPRAVALAALLAFCATTGTWATAERAASNSAVPVTAVDSVGMTVSDMDRAVDFYTSRAVVRESVRRRGARAASTSC